MLMPPSPRLADKRCAMTMDDEIAGLVEQPRCSCCRQPFGAHLIDEDRPTQDNWRVCPRPPSKRERYLPDHEHADLQSRLTEALSRIALLEEAGEIADALCRATVRSYSHKQRDLKLDFESNDDLTLIVVNTGAGSAWQSARDRREP